MTKKPQEQESYMLQKLKYYKRLSGLTYDEIETRAGIDKSTIEKIFQNKTKNPKMETIRALTVALNCTLDDLIEDTSLSITEPKEQIAGYYHNDKTAQLAQEIFENRDLRILMDASKDLSPEDVQVIIDVANRLKKTKH